MICRVCLRDENETLPIFDGTGMDLNIATVLGKYFWFEPKKDDPISKVICKKCWTKILDFHQFYAEVEEAHRLLTERFSVKTDKIKLNQKLNSEDVAKTKDLSTNSSNKTLDITPVLNDSGNSAVLEDKSFSIFGTDHTCQEEFYGNDEESFNGERFMEKLLSDGNSGTADDDNAIRIQTEDSNSKRRMTRATQNLKEKLAADEIQNSHATSPRKRRGRPPKIKEKSRVTKTKNIQKSSVIDENKTVKTSEESPTLKKEDEADAAIAEHVRLICDICSERLPTFSELRSHMMKEHHCKGYAICCSKKFYKRALLSDHVAKHINPDCYKCQDCDKVFADKQCMRNHFLLKHLPEESKAFQCEHCSKKFAKPYLLEQHRVVHEDRKHICSVCQRGFPTASLLGSHIKLTHENLGTMCDVCAQVIRGRANFRRHQLEHEGVIPPKVQCDICGSWHKNKYSLQKHKRRHNEDGTVHICEMCNKVAPNRSALLSHIRYVHSAAAVYQCDICDKSFKKPINLKEHKATHTGEILYKCPHCTKTFNSNANMHSHRKKVHPKEFEEYRKNRIAAKAKSLPIVPIQATARIANDKKNSNDNETVKKETVLNRKNNTNDSDKLPTIFTIQTGENGETHQVIVTSDDNDVSNNYENSVIFTIN